MYFEFVTLMITSLKNSSTDTTQLHVEFNFDIMIV